MGQDMISYNKLSSISMCNITAVKSQQWPTPSESIAVCCVKNTIVSCVTHRQSCAKST